MEYKVNEIKALDIFEAFALDIIPANGILVSGFYADGKNFRLEKTVYTGLKNAFIKNNSIVLDVCSGKRFTGEVSNGKITKLTEKETVNFESAPQYGRNFSFLFFPHGEMENRVDIFIKKLLEFSGK